MANVKLPMSIRAARFKEVVQSTIELIVSAYTMQTSSAHPIEAQPLLLSSATLTLIRTKLTELRFGRADRLQVFTHARLTDLVMAALAHAAKMPLTQLIRGELAECHFPRMTSVCGKLAGSRMGLVHVSVPPDLLRLLVDVPTDSCIRTNVPLSILEMEQIRKLANTRRLMVIHFAMQPMMPAYRFW